MLTKYIRALILPCPSDLTLHHLKDHDWSFWLIMRNPVWMILFEWSCPLPECLSSCPSPECSLIVLQMIDPKSSMDDQSTEVQGWSIKDDQSLVPWTINPQRSLKIPLSVSVCLRLHVHHCLCSCLRPHFCPLFHRCSIYRVLLSSPLWKLEWVSISISVSVSVPVPISVLSSMDDQSTDFS